MQSDSCSLNRLEMASKRKKTFIFKNAEKIEHEETNFLVTVDMKDIMASRKARHFFNKALPTDRPTNQRIRPVIEVLCRT